MTTINGQDITRSGMVSQHGAMPDLLTEEDTYVDVGVWRVAFLKTKHFAFTAAANALDVTILGSLDGGEEYDLTAEAEFEVGTSAAVTKTITGYYTHLKVTVKPAAGGSHGTLTTKFAGASF